MFEIDKLQFGRFVSARRKEKNFTQKELAEKLFISDKAVSKWERGLSLPDISLLIPLADILDITVTELLEGKRIETADTANMMQVEELVKKALAFSDKFPEKSNEKRKTHRIVFFSCILFAAMQWLIVYFATGSFQSMFDSGIVVMHLLSLIFLGYFWIRAKERLPAYYDNNRIHFYHDGFFEMNVPGICFNNRNWPHILRVCRIWSLLGSTVIPIFSLLICWFTPKIVRDIVVLVTLLSYSLGGLFIPVYLVAKKYE